MSDVSHVYQPVEGDLTKTRDRVDRDCLELDRVGEFWVLTHWRTHATLRLRIQQDNLADFDSTERVIFEVKLREATDFHTVADVLIQPGLFATECRDLQFPPRTNEFPWAFRVEFLELVQRWADLRALCEFAPTVSGMPFNG